MPCPLSRRGVDVLAACPGFALQVHHLAEGPGQGLSISTCRFIGTGRTRRGFRAECKHPEREAVVAAALDIVRVPATATVRPLTGTALAAGSSIHHPAPNSQPNSHLATT